MSANSKIEWTDHTFNPWIGCTKVSNAATGGGGCDHCYAEVSTPARVLRSNGAETWGTGAPRVRTGAANWALPMRWNAQHEAFQAQHGRRQRVFCASLGDVFDNAVNPEWRRDLFALIAATPKLDWLLLTKRIGNARGMIARALCEHDVFGGPDQLPEWPWSNVWLGATVVNQAEADRDIPKLLAIPAAKRFLSMEPLLEPVDLNNIEVPMKVGVDVFSALEYDGDPEDDVEFGTATVDWVIVGGESGHRARPMHPDWARSLRDQCVAAGVPFLFKQWGEWAPYDRSRTDGAALATSKSFDEPIQRFGKKIAGRQLDGREWNEVPA
ncbi:MULTISPECIES: phage Gp37/Gp68 family protein [unclassified Variovorax]|uniref:phage Gp37/Gp68 family protein n=1 Tax=unclassified Variovorax TaxID=663243 RepID=UPI003F44B368